MAKQGSTISGLMDAFATVVSLALQHGVPLRVICQKLSHMRFEPSGWSGNPKIGYAKSLMDYIGRWLDLKFLSGDQGELFNGLAMPTLPTTDGKVTDPVEGLGELVQMGDAPACNICGSPMVRSGTCYRCMTCGSTRLVCEDWSHLFRLCKDRLSERRGCDHQETLGRVRLNRNSHRLPPILSW